MTLRLETETKLLFVNPNLRPGNSTGKFLPVGLAYVMTVFRNVGLDYDLLDNRSTYALLVLLTLFGTPNPMGVEPQPRGLEQRLGVA